MYIHRSRKKYKVSLGAASDQSVEGSTKSRGVTTSWFPFTSRFRYRTCIRFRVDTPHPELAGSGAPTPSTSPLISNSLLSLPEAETIWSFAFPLNRTPHVTKYHMDFLKSAVASLGKVSAFPYAFGDKVELDQTVWTLHNGRRKVRRSSTGISRRY